MPANARRSARHRTATKRHRRRLTDRTKRLAREYVAIATGTGKWAWNHGKPDREEWVSGNKRETMRLAKAYARGVLRAGAIVELRANTVDGPIIERVRLAVIGTSPMTQVRWVNDFET